MASQPPPPEEQPVEEEPSEPLKYKTWSLKVSVHCEGCKRKVKKILLGIEGVYTVDVDTKLHKATVTANVDPEILIRKLEKSGKHAELWPEKADQKESKRNKKKKKNNKANEQDNNPENNDNNEDSAPAEQDKPDPSKGEATAPVSRVVEVVNSAKPGGNVQFKEVRVEPIGQTAEPLENNPPEAAATGGGSGGGGGGAGKKKKRKGKGNGGNGNANGNVNGGEPASNGNGEGNEGPPCGPPPMQGQGPPPLMQGQGPPPPRGCYPVYDHPPGYYGPSPPQQGGMPVYAVSYNTAYPSSSYTASYYANPPPYSTYAYVQQGGSDSAEGGPSDTFEMFSDENPNACTVM